MIRAALDTKVLLSALISPHGALDVTYQHLRGGLATWLPVSSWLHLQSSGY